MHANADYVRVFDPLARHWQSFSWGNGTFDSGSRLWTDSVEGRIRIPHHLVLVTLSGGAQSLEVSTACGHRYHGRDLPGAVSFVSASCERRIKMLGVNAKWASISLRSDLLDGDIRPFTNVQDAFIAGLLTELERMMTADGLLDPGYCESMAFALARHLTHRHGNRRHEGDARIWQISPWQIRQLTGYVMEHLEQTLRMSDLANHIGVSTGHFHRAFRTTTGRTPLQFIHEIKIQQACRWLIAQNISVSETALRTGFVSPSHFARVFRRHTGVTPSKYCRH